MKRLDHEIALLEMRSEQLHIQLHVDPLAPIGPKTWVAGFEMSADGLRRPILGPARNLRQSFTVTDVRTGKDVTMGSHHRVFYGAVVGMSRCMLDRRERKFAASAQATKTAKIAKRHARGAEAKP